MPPGPPPAARTRFPRPARPGPGPGPHTWMTVTRWAFGRSGSSASLLRSSGVWLVSNTTGRSRPSAVASHHGVDGAPLARKPGQLQSGSAGPACRSRAAHRHDGDPVTPPGARRASRGPPLSTSVRVIALASDPGAPGAGGRPDGRGRARHPLASWEGPPLFEDEAARRPRLLRRPAARPAPRARFLRGNRPIFQGQHLRQLGEHVVFELPGHGLGHVLAEFPPPGPPLNC